MCTVAVVWSWIQRMSITLQRATPASLDEVTEAVATWQQDGGPVQLHPGDLGWHWRLGAEELAGAVRVWRRHGQILAVGVVDDSGLIRMAIAPSADRDDAFADQLLADLSEPGRRGELPADTGVVEARFGAAFRSRLRESGWVADEPWTPLCRDLTEHVEDCGLRVEVVDAHNVRGTGRGAAGGVLQLDVHPGALARDGRSPPYRRARCLVGYDAHGHAVAAVTVWSAGPGRPGLLNHWVSIGSPWTRYGTAISVAAAAALREMGASSATVCTPSSNVGAVATYASAGFRQLPDVTDFRRMSPPRPLIG